MDWKTIADTTFSDVLTGRNLRRLVLLWFAGLLMLGVYAALKVRVGQAPSWSSLSPEVDEGKTQGFVMWRRNPDDSGKPLCKVAFDDLRAENGSLGPFQTAAYKVMCIDNLDVAFRKPAADANQPNRLGEFQDFFASPDGQGEATALCELQGLQDVMRDWGLSLDLTNAAGVQVNRMDWRVYRDDHVVFRIQCRQARLAGTKSEVLLRGHAKVAVRGATLESNCIRMDGRREQFLVDGPYLLVRDGVSRTGVGACFDAELRMLGDHSS